MSQPFVPSSGKLLSMIADAEASFDRDRARALAPTAAGPAAQFCAQFWQISRLREESLTAGDTLMARVCDVALGGESEASREGLTEDESRRLSEFTEESALAECDRVITAAAANSEEG